MGNKVQRKNVGAKELWTKIVKPYSPFVYRINEDETVLEFVN